MQQSVITLLVATVVLLTLFVLSFRFSGSPYRNHVYRTKLRKITCVTLVWSLSRVLRGIEGVIQRESFEELVKGLDNDKEIVTSIVWIILLVLVDAVPYIIVLDWSFMSIFTLDGNQTIITEEASPNLVSRVGDSLLDKKSLLSHARN